VKLLIDENLSFKLVPRLADLFPGSVHVRDVGMLRTDDVVVMKFAADNGFCIVTKDEDFHQRLLLFGPPPKLVRITRGNCSTAVIEEMLRVNAEAIKRFCDDPEASFLTLA
jgi:predicted nuclease of predicted toxin-antitoxin system